MMPLGPLETDLSSAPLTEPDKFHIRLTPLQAGIYHGVSMAMPNADVGLLSGMGPDQIAEANRRLMLILAYQAREPLDPNVSTRTVRHWLHRFRQAEALHGDGYLGLLPRFP